jgi:amino acid transporter
MSSLEKGKSTISFHQEDSNSIGLQNATYLQRFTHSFKRRNVEITENIDFDSMDEYTKRNYILSIQPMKKDVLKTRHLQMIAIGGTIGTGLFIGLGYSLSQGPLATLIGFLIVGAGIYCVIQAGAEMQSYIPISGSFAAHVTRFVDPALGFTISSNYALAWLISFPSELIGASMTVRYWSDVDPVSWIALFWAFIVGLNLFGVRAYGESEFLMSIIKVIAIVIFIIIGIVLICGGGPNSQGYIGARYWHDPGPFVHPILKSICSTLVSAGFSFGGTELAILSSESEVKAIKRASKQVFWRIILFYITTIVVISCLVPSNDERLLGGSTSEDISASPFVIALSNTGVFGTRVSHFMNAIILIAVLSVGNSCIFASSRVIQALGASGQLPQIFAYIDNEGRPLVGILVAAVFGLLAFLVASSKEDIVFTWLFSLCSISSFFTWSSICIAHIRFRLAFRKQGRSTVELPHSATLGIWGSIIGVIVFFFVIVGEIWISIWPIGSPADAETFFQNCLSIPLMIVVFLSYKIYAGGFLTRWWIPLSDVDLDTGKRYPDVDLFLEEKETDRIRLQNKPLYYKIYRFFC